MRKTLGYMQHARHAIHGTCPDTLARLHATGPRIWCSMSSAHVFAPCSSSMRMTSTLPYLNTPTCNGVWHLLFSMHAFAPCSSSTRMTLALPYSATVCNGVEPLYPVCLGHHCAQAIIGRLQPATPVHLQYSKHVSGD